MIIDVKILDKLLLINSSNMSYDQVGSHLGMRGWHNIWKNQLMQYTIINQKKGGNHMIISTGRKNNWQNPKLIHDKKSQHLRREENVSPRRPHRAATQLTANITLHGENSEQQERRPPSRLLLNNALKVLVSVTREK